MCSYCAGDTVGCGYDTRSKDIFFTVNGTRQPPIPVLQSFMEETALKAHSTVSLGSEQDAVLVNIRGSFL